VLKKVLGLILSEQNKIIERLENIEYELNDIDTDSENITSSMESYIEEAVTNQCDDFVPLEDVRCNVNDMLEHEVEMKLEDAFDKSKKNLVNSKTNIKTLENLCIAFLDSKKREDKISDHMFFQLKKPFITNLIDSMTWRPSDNDKWLIDMINKITKAATVVDRAQTIIKERQDFINEIDLIDTWITNIMCFSNVVKGQK